MNPKFVLTNCKIGSMVADINKPLTQTIFVTDRLEYIGTRQSDDEGHKFEEVTVEAEPHELNYNERYESGAMATPEAGGMDKDGWRAEAPQKIDRSKAYLQLKIRLKKLIEEDQQHFKELKESLNDDKSMEYSSRDAEFDDSAHKVLQRLDQLTKISEDSVKPLLEFAKNAASGFGDDSWFHEMVDLLWTYQSQYCRY